MRLLRSLTESRIKLWFIKTDLFQAEDTFRVVQGILEARREAQPKRARRYLFAEGGVVMNIEEYDIRVWFIKTDLFQAERVFRLVQGILEARREDG